MQMPKVILFSCVPVIFSRFGEVRIGDDGEVTGSSS